MSRPELSWCVTADDTSLDTASPTTGDCFRGIYVWVCVCGAVEEGLFWRVRHAWQPDENWWLGRMLYLSSCWCVLLCRTCQAGSDMTTAAVVRSCQRYRHNSIKRSITARPRPTIVSWWWFNNKRVVSLCDTGQKWISDGWKFSYQLSWKINK